MRLSFHELLVRAWVTLALALVVTAAGCATTKTDWNSRLGQYSFDQAVLDFGPPDKHARLSNGTVVAEWLVYRGRSHTHVSLAYTHGYYGHPYGHGYYAPIYHHYPPEPNSYLRLTFGPDGQLTSWKRFRK